MRVLIIGAGGHAQVVVDALTCMQADGVDIEVLGFLDDNPAIQGQSVSQRPVLGTTTDICLFEHDAIVIAIGDNLIRRRLYNRFYASGESFCVVRHPRSTIASDVYLGPGTMICAGVVVNTGSKIGANTILNTSCTVDHHCNIGEHCHVAPGVQLGGEVRVGEGSLIGIGSIVLPRQRIGLQCTVGAGAVVHRDTADFSTVVGVPARPLPENE